MVDLLKYNKIKNEIWCYYFFYKKCIWKGYFIIFFIGNFYVKELKRLKKVLLFCLNI